MFADQTAAAAALADDLAVLLNQALAERGRASLVVPGGRGPVPVFQRLAAADLDWTRIDVIPTDERWVSPDHPDSNEGMIRRLLPAARLRGLKTDAATPEDGLAEASARLATLGRPFDAVFLGMGADGHVASLFPGSVPLDDRRMLAAAPVSGIGHARLTLTLPALTDCRALLLLICGAEKRARWAEALAGADLPVTRAVRAAPQVRVFLAP
ncbi:MAG: 6-phosphogluconolactonase [Alphaproteobacteria bacterium]|nr:6-phosphogluconolactonase [Alphaproteobacteria bacterium]